MNSVEAVSVEAPPCVDSSMVEKKTPSKRVWMITGVIFIQFIIVATAVLITLAVTGVLTKDSVSVELAPNSINNFKQLDKINTDNVIQSPQHHFITATPPTYPLYCKGGLRAFQLAAAQSTTAGVSNNNGFTFIWFFFNQGSSGFDNNPNALQSGQCTWGDRGLNSGEPNALIYYPSVYTEGLNCSPSGACEVCPSCGGTFRNGDSIVSALIALTNGANTNSVYVFNVYNNNQVAGSEQPGLQITSCSSGC